MKARELQLCQIQEWYPRFSSISLKTALHPLPETFVSYLQADAFFLPANSKALPSRRSRNLKSSSSNGGPSLDFDSDDDKEEGYHKWREEEDETEEPEEVSFPGLESEIEASIAELGGSVFPKLNWSAPKDSAWIGSSGSLLCKNFGEICLLLKASDSLVHDLCHAFDSCDDKTSERPDQFFLALRKWYDLRPEMEFRGFVRHGLLVGVSQREVTGFYPSLVESQTQLEKSVFDFFVENLSEVFELEDYTFDCYITRSGSVKLIDFNPWGAFTLPLLFTWDELEEISARLSLELADLSREYEDLNTSSDADLNPKKELTSDTKLCLKKVSSTATESDIKNLLSSATTSDTLRKSLSSNVESHAMQSSLSSNTESHAMKSLGSDSESKLKKSFISDSGTHTMKFLGSDTEADSKKSSNIKLYACGLKPEFRIVRSDCHVRVNLRMGGGVPYDYVESGPGSAWDEFLQRAGEELKHQNRDSAAGG